MLGVDGTFDIRVWVLRCVQYPEHDSMTVCCVGAVMHKPSFDVSSSLPHGFHDAIATQRPQKDQIGRRSSCVSTFRLFIMRRTDDGRDALVL